MSFVYNNDNSFSDNETKNYKVSLENNVITSIDKRLEQLEKQKEEIQKKYGINESLLNSININLNNFKFPQYIHKRVNRPVLEESKNLTKIEVQKSIEKSKNLNINYKTPDKLVDSFKI